ncbi:kinesin-like protein subito [Eupeodes corollae]|uniref:kinesin-like protein subito n=1 Tax=Eupeodes corollae TaxID=290404 RepID=UPI0024937D11|nr:kinesin-like protein subito [Eupeodes corollae]
MPNPVDPEKREVRSFLVSRDPSVDRRFRPCPERQVALFQNLEEEEDEEDEAYDESASMASSNTAVEQEGALIYLRMRPLPNEIPCSSYKILGNVLVTSQLDCSGNTGKNQMEKHFTFSEIFDNAIDQHAIYEKCIRSKIESEENFTMLTYGTSGSGKTHTLLGDLDKPGIIPRAIENVFALYASNLYPQPAAKVVNAIVSIVDDESMRKEMLLRQTIISACNDVQSVYNRVQQKIASQHDFNTTVLENTSVFVWVSFVEIYNEFVYDLLSPIAATGTTRRKNHKIVSNDGKVFIKDLTSVHAKMAADAYKLLTFGLQKVKYASTAINSNSSRSHCIFFIDIIKFSQPGTFTLTSYKFCDLAGSERLSKTGNVGSRLKEAQRINTSLMVLGRCLDAANNQKKKNGDVIPFRESKLTMLLQSALLGKEKLSMVVNITPSDKYFEENMNVLGFASIAKNIVFKQPILKTDRSARYSWFVVHAGQDKRSTAAEDTSQLDALLEENFTLRNENDRLISEVSRLEKALSQQEYDLRNQLVNNFQKSLEERNRSWEDRLAREIEMVKQKYENKIVALKAEHARELEDINEEVTQVKKRRATLGDYTNNILNVP